MGLFVYKQPALTAPALPLLAQLFVVPASFSQPDPPQGSYSAASPAALKGL